MSVTFAALYSSVSKLRVAFFTSSTSCPKVGFKVTLPIKGCLSLALPCSSAALGKRTMLRLRVAGSALLHVHRESGRAQLSRVATPLLLLKG
jgi:hypothetical protein